MTDEQVKKAIEIGMIYSSGVTSGRFSHSTPNVSSIPRNACDYSKLEPHVWIEASYPGKDGIGCDIYQTVANDIEEFRRAWNAQVHANKDTTFRTPVIGNSKTHCPKCDIKWQEIALFNSFVFNCPQCGAKKEDYANISR